MLLLLKKFLFWIKNAKNTVVKIDSTPHEVELAFEIKGRRFYRFANEFNMPVCRYQAYMDVAEEIDQRIDREYLSALFETLETACNAGRIVDIAHMISIAKQKLEQVSHYSLLYKLAAVIYFEKSENLERYDALTAARKIEFWKKNQESISDFFLQTRMHDFAPFLSQLGGDSEKFFQAQDLDEKLSLDALSRIFKRYPENASLMNFISERTEMLDR